MRKHLLTITAGTLMSVLAVSAQPRYDYANMQTEKLTRGLVAVKTSGGVFVSWRLFGTDPDDIQFELQRNGTTVSTLKTKTNYVDATGTASGKYRVIARRGDGSPIDSTETVTPWNKLYTTVDIDRPASYTNAAGEVVEYHPNDCNTGDVDGDGEYEIIMMWRPGDAEDNAIPGKTGRTYIDCYKIKENRKLWRIDLGDNIRSGSHYTQFMVYDLDGDGRAEVAMKTAPGTVDGTGAFVSAVGDCEEIRSCDNSISYVNTENTCSKYGIGGDNTGKITSGPEFLTVFDGLTGAAITTTQYWPPRGMNSNDPTPNVLNALWGDGYGNRCDRFLACIAYLDGLKPSLVMCRGYYQRTCVAAYDFADGRLSMKWKYQTAAESANSLYGAGAHSLAVADVDGDGCDEIIYGAATLDHDGKVLYNTMLKHGDALHVGDFYPDRPGLEVFMVHEEKGGFDIHDAATGEILYRLNSDGDNGRGVCGDLFPESRGAEFWSAADYNVYGVDGKILTRDMRPEYEFRIYWDGDAQDETVNCNKLYKNTMSGNSQIMRFGDHGKSSAMLGSKKHPLLQADLFGDWREEIVFFNGETVNQLNIFTSTIESPLRVPTLMDDHVYRMAVAWQNVAYNQPPHISYYLEDSVAARIYCDETLLTQETALGNPIKDITLRMKGGTMSALRCTGLPEGLSFIKDTDTDPMGMTYRISGTPTTAGMKIFTILSTGGPQSARLNGRINVTGSTADGITDATVTDGRKTHRAYTVDGRAIHGSIKDLRPGVYVIDGIKRMIK